MSTKVKGRPRTVLDKTCVCGVVFRARSRQKFHSRSCYTRTCHRSVHSPEFIGMVKDLIAAGHARSHIGDLLDVSKGVISGIAFRRGIKPPSHV